MPGRQPPPIVHRSVDLRYSGQDYPLEIQVEGRCDVSSTKDDWEARFEALYRSHYGKVDDDNPVELASIRVHVSQPPPTLTIASAGGGGRRRAQGMARHPCPGRLRHGAGAGV